jgi:YhcH/YjgK/YiaL family protein
MIHSSLSDANRYADLHPSFANALAFLNETDLTALEPGKHLIDGDKLFAICEVITGRGKAASPLEAHNRYIDIQLLVSGEEVIGWRDRTTCADITTPYSDERDILFFGDEPTTWVELQPGELVILFPEDAHAPCASTTDMRKIVLKIAL